MELQLKRYIAEKGGLASVDREDTVPGLQSGRLCRHTRHQFTDVGFVHARLHEQDGREQKRKQKVKAGPRN